MKSGQPQAQIQDGLPPALDEDEQLVLLEDDGWTVWQFVLLFAVFGAIGCLFYPIYQLIAFYGIWRGLGALIQRTH